MAALLDDDALLAGLERDVEKAGIFAQAGISWYLDIARNRDHAVTLMPALRGLLAALSLYRTDRLFHTRDVLRDLYQGLVPGKLRQSLGEFYTPDWLIDFTLEAAETSDWLSKRVLDPTCGSGAFLAAVIRHKRREATAAGWEAERIVHHLCTEVWGFDLNPLAVQTACINFLMEIADLLKAAPGQVIEVPVLLADAIYSPAPEPAEGQPVMKYRIGSQVAALEILLPAALGLDRVRLDQVFACMGEEVELDHDYDRAEAELLAAGLLTDHEAVEWRDPLAFTYGQILALHRKEWNGIWFRVVRNFFWSATAGHFDLIVGNPPWVRWSKLPELYRERVSPTCEQYGIFSQTRYHGGNELDISAMITYTTSDKWLRPGGRLAFVLTGTLFKNPSSSGFRSFRLKPADPETLHLSPVGVDDMKALKPFEDASNHTVVAVFDKSAAAATYPVPYRLWSSAETYSRNIPAQLDLATVRTRIVCTRKEAVPVGSLGSPWAVLTKGRHADLEALSGTCEWASGRKGITADLNGVYFVPVIAHSSTAVQIRSRPEAGKTDLGSPRVAWVEPDLLYPLIKGASDFEACYLRLANPQRAEAPLYTFVPNTGITAADYAAAAAALNSPRLARTKAWFATYKDLLEARSTYRRQMKGAPYHAVYNVGAYTFQPWKVIWPEMIPSTGFYAAVASSSAVPVAGERPYVPDHKVYFVSFDTKEPAHFLCGLLNTPMVREWIDGHIVKTQVGDVFKHMRLPEFSLADPRHLALARLVEEAHAEHDAAVRAVLVARICADGEAILRDWMKR